MKIVLLTSITSLISHEMKEQAYIRINELQYTNFSFPETSPPPPFHCTFAIVTPLVRTPPGKQSRACISKIMSRLAPVRLFQTVSHLALSRIFQKKNSRHYPFASSRIASVKLCRVVFASLDFGCVTEF